MDLKFNTFQDNNDIEQYIDDNAYLGYVFDKKVKELTVSCKTNFTNLRNRCINCTVRLFKE